MFGLFPLLICILAAILLKWLLELGFRMAGRPADTAPVLEDRVGGILFLLCADVLGVIAYWYPYYVITHYAAPDDRFGGFILFGIPFYIAGAGLSGWALFCLGRAVIRGRRSLVNAVYAICGVLLAAVGFSPLVMFARKIIQIRQDG